jgi:prevent-host-death family protein
MIVMIRAAASGTVPPNRFVNVSQAVSAETRSRLRMVRDRPSCTSKVRPGVTAVSISHARENLFPLVRQVNEDHVVIEIVARNGGNAALMSAEDYESLQETLYLFSTRAKG